MDNTGTHDPLVNPVKESPHRLQLRFWGVRGSVATPEEDRLAFGGNTSCMEVRVPGECAVTMIDAGTGIRKLDEHLCSEFPAERPAFQFLMTHFHWDHIQGLPFFSPLYRSGDRLTFCCARPVSKIEEILEGQMSHPYFPVPFELVAARREFADTSAGAVRLGDLRVSSFQLNHPQGSCGYRIEAGGAVAVTVFDHEHGNARIDSAIRDNAQNADVLIYDSQYTPREYEARRGWGHSTYAEAVRLARDTSAGRLILFHHDPGRSDDALREIVAEARKSFENTEAAREGLTIRL